MFSRAVIVASTRYSKPCSEDNDRAQRRPHERKDRLGACRLTQDLTPKFWRLLVKMPRGQITYTSGDMPDSGLDVLNQSGDSIEVALAKQLLA